MERASAPHETLRREEAIVGPSDRSFGLTFALVFALLAALAAWRDWRVGPVWFSAACLAFGLAGFLRPSVLAPLNQAWLRFGLVLHRIMTPLILGIMYFLIFTPMGVLMRAFGKDFLRLKRDPKAISYWISREPPGPPPESIKNQF